jgi:HEAT repeat protein
MVDSKCDVSHHVKNRKKAKDEHFTPLDLKTLSKMVRSANYKKRKEAAEKIILNEHMDLEHLNLLKRLIKDDNEKVVVSATAALGSLAYSHTIAREYLMDLVADDLFWIKKRGISALGEYAKYDHDGIMILSSLAYTKKKDVVEEAIFVLGSIALENDYAQDVLTDLLKSKDELILQPTISFLGILAKEKEGVLSQLKLLLHNDNNFIRLWSASAIGEAAQENEIALSLFWEFPQNDDVYLRRGFSKKLAVLTKKDPEGALKLIEKACEDTDRYVRTNSVSALGSLSGQNKEAFSKIKKLLDHDNADVRRGAADALLDVPKQFKGDIEPLINKIVSDDDYYLRSASAFIVVKIANLFPKEAFGFLMKLAEDRDEYVRRDLAMALGRITDEGQVDIYPIVAKLLEDRESIVRREAVSSLRAIVLENPKKVAFQIPHLAKDNDENVRKNSVEVLGILANKSPKSAFSTVLGFVSDESFAVSQQVAFCLEKIFDKEPDKFIKRMKVAQSQGISSEILRLILKYAKDESIGAICGFFANMGGDLTKLNLEKHLSSQLDDINDVGTIKYSDCVYNLFSTLLSGIRVRDINDLAMIRFKTRSISPIYGSSEDEEDIFEILESLPEMALRYKQIEGLSDRHIYLSKMLSSIDSKLEVLPGDLSSETYILSNVLHNFRQVVSDTMDVLKGRSDLKISLRTKKVLPQDTITLLLGLENTGESLAENINVQLMPSPSYKIVDKTKEIMMLAHEREDAVEFRIKPSKKKTFRVKFKLSWDDFEKAGKSMEFADLVNFIDIPKEFKYIPNPYITGGPIKPNSANMFFGRDDVFNFILDNISCASQKNVLILQGERRTGKTSILYQISQVLDPEYISVFMDGQEFGATTLDYFFYKMAKHISTACKKEGIEIKAPSKSQFENDAWYTFKDEFLEELNSKIQNRYIVILFDEFEALEHAVTSQKLDPMIFNYIRNLMQHEDNLVFIFAGVHRLEEMMQDYWGVMFNIAMYWRISFLKESETRKLISNPVAGYNMIYDDLAVEKIIRATASHPYFVQLLCRFLVNRHNNEKRNYITVQDVNEELLNVIEKAKPHFDYIWTLSSTYEKLILALLVNTLRVRTIVTQKDLLDECERLNLFVDKKKFSKALSNLTTKEILEMVSFGSVHYQFKVDFIRMWVERYQPLSKVIEEFGDELGA